MKTKYYQINYANEVTKLNVEKQQLIKFLEENIRKRLDTIKFDKEQDTIEELEKIISRQLGELNAFQEVLDFINKGGKEWKDY